MVITSSLEVDIIIERKSLKSLANNQWVDSDVIGAYTHFINQRNIIRNNNSGQGSSTSSVAQVYCFNSLYCPLLTGSYHRYDYGKVRSVANPKTR